MFLQHLHYGLQLSQPEALRQGASSLKGHSCPLQQVRALQRVRLQTRLPQPGPESAAATASPARVRRAHPHLNIPSLTLPSARDAAIPLTSIARLCLDTHVNTGQEASTHWPFLQGVSAAESIQSQSPTGSDCSENPINCSQSGDTLRKVKPNHLKPSHSRKKYFCSL